MAIASWSLVRIYGTWVNHAGTKLPGSYKIKVPVRLTNSADDEIIPAGIFASGDLVVAAGVPSLSIECPSTDDPDIQQDGWKLEVEIAFSGGQAGEKYVIEVPMADRPLAAGGTGKGVNLRTIALTSQLPPQAAMYGVGRPSGLALLSDDGTAVLDADGNPISSGGGGGTTTVVGLTDATAVGKAVVKADSASTARTVLGAVASTDTRLSDQRTPTNSSVTNAKVAAGAGIDQSKIAGLPDALAARMVQKPGSLGVFQGVYEAGDGPTTFAATDWWIELEA